MYAQTYTALTHKDTHDVNQIPEPTDAQHAPGAPADTAQPAAAAATSAEETHEVADEINIAELPAHLNPAHEDFDPSAGLERWAEQMDVYTGPDAMLDFNQVDYVHIDLSEANPSGLAQLLAGRKTRLSTILRDKSQLEAGMRSARTLRTKIYELATDHGLDSGYFVAGTASWLSHDTREDAAAYEKRFIAPILMAPLSITPHPKDDDFELRLAGSARLNPAMVRQIKQEYGIDLGTMDVAQLANSMSRLDPEPVIERMRASAGRIPGMTIESKYFISTFADLKESLGELPHTAITPLVRDLAALKVPGVKPRELNAHNLQPPLDQRDPAEEMLLLDADANAQEIVDTAVSGFSFTITAAPGTEPLRTAVNIASALMGRGKSVLVVGEKRSTLAEFSALLKRTGIESLRYDLLAEHDAEAQRAEFIRAIVRNESAEEPNSEDLNEELVATRAALLDHTRALLNKDSNWQISVYSALQRLAELTASEDGPATRVRFDRPMLDSLLEREQVRAELVRLGEIDGFAAASRTSPWYRARLVNDEEAAEAYALVITLKSSLLNLREAMNQTSAMLGLRRGRTISEWESQLAILMRIRETLKRFRADVYDRPVTDLIAATASGAWRRENGIEMSSMQRSRLRRAAKEYILPGVNIGDLHEQLKIVQAERAEWIRHIEAPRTPQIPENLDQLAAALNSLVSELAGLGIVLADTVEGTDFVRTDLDALDARLDALMADRVLLMTLPERDALIQKLRERGLSELLDDLYARQVPTEVVSAELELAWWQSALEFLLQHHEGKLLDGDRLRDTESRFRRADYAHMTSAPARLLAKMARVWTDRIESEHDQAAYLKSQLRGYEFVLEELLTHAPVMARTLLPLWTASPFALARKVPASMRFDTVLLLDSESTPLAANLPAITRADQVIALGDPHSGYPSPFIVSAPTFGAPEPTDEQLDSTFDVLATILPNRTLAMLHRSMDPVILDYLNREFYGSQLHAAPVSRASAQPAGSLTVEYIDTRGKVSDNANLDSPGVEVERVTNLVLEHAYRTPDRSLAVVTASPKHAQRVAESVRHALSLYPQLAPFFAAGEESFRVVDLTRAESLERDTVIFSLGVGRARLGQASYDLGQLSAEHGRQGFVVALTRARRALRIVSCIDPSELDPQKLHHGAVDFYHLLREHAERQEREEAEAKAQRVPETLPRNAFLAADEADTPDLGDWLLNDLVARLQACGVRVTRGEGDIALIAHAPEKLAAEPVPALGVAPVVSSNPSVPAAMPLVACSDGEQNYARASVRERTRLLPERLSRTGWNYITLGTLEVFADPDSVVARVLHYLDMDEGAEVRG